MLETVRLLAILERMFDQEDPAGYDAWLEERACALDLIDESEMQVPSPAVTEAEFAAWAAELDGHSVVAPVVSDAAVCAGVAEGWTGLAGGVLARLDGVALEGLTGDAAVDAAVAFDRVANRVAARRMRAVATAVRRQLGTERVDPIRLASAELAAALTLGSGSIGAEVTCALALTGPLTRTLAAMDAGDVAYPKARFLVEQTLDLFDHQAQAVEALVLDAAAGRTWAQHAAAVRRAVVRVGGARTRSGPAGWSAATATTGSPS